MIQKTTKNTGSTRGFTLVELLIVIVVIAILAAITIIAYNGVQNKAHTTAANSAASEVIKKAALYQTENNAYPATLSVLQTATAGFTTSDPAFLSSSDVHDQGSTVMSSGPSQDNTVFYYKCTGGNGAMAVYWDYSASATKVLTTGTATVSGATCA